MFTKILVANRAEIAVRVLRTCRELGVTGVAVYSDPDIASLHVRSADMAFPLHGVTAVETYLDKDKIIGIALEAGADAIHPGYGFLAENAEFARMVVDAGIAFIGPPSAAIEAMGEKVAARLAATEAGVPQVPGSGAISDVKDVLAFGQQYGYPIAIKASYGGGGRGMRTVQSAADAADALDAARREASSAFGKADVYLERYLEHARHVEVQLFADQYGNAVWLGDRDCSVQRRHQKVIEEAPAPGLSRELRRAMGEASVSLARSVGYVGAGTVEFLVEADPEAFFFLEMNTRIQVEHPVSEATLGLDLVAEQIRIAAGETLTIATSGPEPRGHAIEIRVNAEDVAGGAFRPSPGPIRRLTVPQRAGVRFDGGYETGDEVLPYYDSLIGKLVVWAPTREHAIARALQAAAEMIIEGVPTTLPAALVVLAHADFRAARMTTRWLENEIDIATLLPSVERSDGSGEDELGLVDRQDVTVAGRSYTVPLPGEAVLIRSSAPNRTAHGTVSRTSGGHARSRPSRDAARSGSVTSPMQGTVAKMMVSPEMEVAQGETLLILEAMKMENPVKAPFHGIVNSLHAEVGQVVSAGTLLVQITPIENAVDDAKGDDA